MASTIVRLAAFGFVAGVVACATGGPDEPSAPTAPPPSHPTPPPPPAAPTSLTIFPRIGNPADDPLAPLGPGIALVGGGDVDQVFVWTHDTIAGPPMRFAGDLVILRTSGDDAYDAYAYALARFNSVQTVRVEPGATPEDFAAAAAIVTLAEAVYFADGDVATYVSWKGTPVALAVAQAFARGAVVGGTGAGAAMLGSFVYDADATAAVDSPEALANPYEPRIHFTRDLFPVPLLPGVVVEPSFFAHNRFGRLAVFMARQVVDGVLTTTPPRALGVGVDEGNALVIDGAGRATLLQRPDANGGAYVVAGGAPLRRAQRDATRFAGRGDGACGGLRDGVRVRGERRRGRVARVHPRGPLRRAGRGAALRVPGRGTVGPFSPASASAPRSSSALNPSSAARASAATSTVRAAAGDASSAAAPA